MSALIFEVLENGDQYVADRVFEGETFQHLEINPPINISCELRNITFKECKTYPGTCVVAPGVQLSRVVFDNLDCGDALRIASETQMNEVVIKGKKPKQLIIKPDDRHEFATRDTEITHECCLDITDFQGEVTVMGIPGHLIRTNTDRHVEVKADWQHEIDWSALGIAPFSFWRIFVKKVVVANVSQGTFTLPSKRDKDYQETIEEGRRLKQAGFLNGCTSWL